MATFNLIFHLILKILKFFETFIIDGKGSIFFYLSFIELKINMTHLKNKQEFRTKNIIKNIIKTIGVNNGN